MIQIFPFCRILFSADSSVFKLGKKEKPLCIRSLNVSAVKKKEFHFNCLITQKVVKINVPEI